MRRESALLVLILMLAAAASAQFTGLTSTGDGSDLYFSSTLRLRGSTDTFDSKIFRIDEQGPSLVAARDRGHQIGWTWTQFYDLILPQVSSDGSAIAFTGVRVCSGGGGCLGVELAEGTVADAAGNERLRGTGHVDLSRNGRYALFFGRNQYHQSSPSELVDMVTGERFPLAYYIGINARRRVADDGTVAFTDAAGVRLWTRDREQVIPVTLGSSSWGQDPLLMIANDAKRFVYQSAAGLARYDITRGTEEIITPGAPLSVSISDDAGTIAFVDKDDRQIHIGGTPSRVLTQDSAGFSEVALSGSGQVAFGVTNGGLLVRIEVASGTVTELVPRTPSLITPLRAGLAGSGGLAAGSLLPLTGVGLSDTTALASPPLPRELGGVRVRIGGMDAAVHAVAPDVVWVQVPWEAPEQQQARFEFLSGNSPFETGPGTVRVAKVAPHVFGTPDTTEGYSFDVKAVHEDWSALVTRQSPARSGEVIHVYFNGLGPVSPAIATGEAGPAYPPAWVSGLTCECGPIASEVLYAGLAPGMVGIYQVSLRVPFGLQSTRQYLTCGFSLLLSAGGSISIVEATSLAAPLASAVDQHRGTGLSDGQKAVRMLRMLEESVRTPVPLNRREAGRSVQDNRGTSVGHGVSR